jgi:putative chitinase
VTPTEAKRLQANLGVAADGAIGRGTLTALFRKFGATPERAAELALAANVHFAVYGILDTPLRLAHFMAQLIHESGSFRYMEEIASGQAYEGRRDLGNVEAGDGKRFKGRGPIQLTGRTNYRVYGRAIGIDFERHPELVATPSIGLMVACMFWSTHGLNELADADNVERITRKINGGLNGFEDRKLQLKRVKALL